MPLDQEFLPYHLVLWLTLTLGRHCTDSAVILATIWLRPTDFRIRPNFGPISYRLSYSLSRVPVPDQSVGVKIYIINGSEFVLILMELHILHVMAKAKANIKTAVIAYKTCWRIDAQHCPAIFQPLHFHIILSLFLFYFHCKITKSETICVSLRIQPSCLNKFYCSVTVLPRGSVLTFSVRPLLQPNHLYLYP